MLMAPLVAVWISALFVCASAEATGEPIRVFDARLSLTGDCSVSEEDPVPDPGCPGGVHPPKSFRNACGAATDSYGNVYVASSAAGNTAGTVNEGRVDVFNAKGEFLSEIKDHHQPCDLAVDSEGNLYILEHADEERILLFVPGSYPPQAGTQYPTESEAVVVHRSPPGFCGRAKAIAVDPSNDHLYTLLQCTAISEYGSAAENLPSNEWTPTKEEIGAGIEGVALNGGFEVYGKNHDIYSAGWDNTSANGSLPDAQRVFIIDGTTGAKVCESAGLGTPAGHFSFVFGNAAIAIDQASGDFYVDDTHVNKVIDRFNASCGYVDQLPTHPPATKGPTLQQPDLRAGLAVSSPCIGLGGTSCDLGGYHGPEENEGNVYVGSGQGEGSSHLFAFPLKVPGPPEIEAQGVTDVTATEARLSAQVDPHALDTSYHFEYISQAAYEANGNEFDTGATSVPVPDADAGDGASFVPVSAPVAGLQPGTAYRFRLVASNCETPGAIEGECLTKGEGEPGKDGKDATFATYPPEAEGLPDHRGYELVTPPGTGGYVATMSELGFSGLGSSAAFATDFAGPGGESLLFGIEGGSLPGFPGGGFHDTYEAHRKSDGTYGRWLSEFNGITGAEAWQPTPNGFSSDHSFAFWAVEKGGAIVQERGNYIRRSNGVLNPKCSPEPAGDLELIGCGSLGTDAWAGGGWISAGAGHVVFATLNENNREAQRLEPQAPLTGTGAIYDHTSDGVTHVVSLKPGNSPFGVGEAASYQGTSADGTAVAFEVEGTLYVRLDDNETIQAASTGKNPVFGGLSEHGGRIVYLRPNATKPLLEGTKIPQGEIFVCDVRAGSCAGPGQTQAPIQIGSGEESIIVNVSADGSHIYFVSPKQLDGSNGGVGEDNLYLWDGSGVHFVTDLEASDVTGRTSLAEQIGGLGLWVTHAVAPFPEVRRGPASDPSRSTPTGTVLVFESRAELTNYDSDGHSEVYRYDSDTGDVACLSCNPTGVAAVSDAQLESDPPPQFVSLPPVNALASIANVSVNGRRVFFQSADRLVLGDTDGKLDVYEWEADGEGDCDHVGGCVRLISSGRSAADDYLYAMTPDGHDVFFESGDLLVPRDTESAASIYDARVDGGEAPEALPPQPCQGDACQSPASSPQDATPASSSFEGPGDASHAKAPCPKGRQRFRRHGKAQCVKRHPRHRKHHQRKRGHTHANRRTGR